MKMRLLQIGLIVLFLFVNAQVYSQEYMTLESAISIGLENNYNIKINEGAIKIAENNNSWAKAGKGPRVDLNANFSNNFTQDNNPFSFVQGLSYVGSLGASLDANWIVLDGGRIGIAKDQLNIAVIQSQLNKSRGIQDLLRTISQMYYNVLVQQERLDILQKNLALSNSRLAYEKVKREFGTSNAYNIIQFQNAILTDSSALINQALQIDLAKRNLYQALDLSPQKNYLFEEQLSTEIEYIDTEGLQDDLINQNQDLKTIMLVTELNQLNSKLADAAMKPTLSIGASVGFNQNAAKLFEENPNTGKDFELAWSNRIQGSLFANFNWNIYDGGARKADIQNAQLQEEIDQLSLLNAKADLISQLDLLASNYNTQIEQINLADQQISIARRNMEMTEERFKAGRISSIDFRNIQNQYVLAALNKLNAIYSLMITKTEIDWLMGRYEE